MVCHLFFARSHHRPAARPIRAIATRRPFSDRSVGRNARPSGSLVPPPAKNRRGVAKRAQPHRRRAEFFALPLLFCVFCAFLRLFQLRDEDQAMGIESDVSRRVILNIMARIRQRRARYHLEAPGAPNRAEHFTTECARRENRRSEPGFDRFTGFCRWRWYYHGT